MPFFQDLLTKVETLVTEAAGFFTGLIGKLLEKIPEEKRRLFLTGIGCGFAVLLLVCAGAALLRKKPEAVALPSAAGASPRQTVIPPEDLFLPEEPDFIPGVLLERERRTRWTAEDAAPHWQDPLKNGEEQWRDRVEAMTDELLERIP
jgi:hypothetical protein